MKNCRVLLLIATFFSLLATSSFGHTFHGAALAPDGQNGWVVASDTAGYILHTPNCGMSWTRQSIPDNRRLYDVFFLTEQKGWIGSDYGFVFYSPNGGDTWIRQTAGLAEINSRIFFIDNNCGWVSCYGNVFGRTSDGGQYWEQIWLPPFPCDTVYFRGVSFVDRRRGWICAGRLPINDPWPWDTFFGGQGYIAMSSDSGLNW